ncbi:MinD/ParA family ATP-binding protein [Arthrobacter sp. 35W]|uniref:MinD/ParA family ATP-binding protein n=1 Tax=Arthrobacter sp. 35W TaxID=1132441 RepID=UPI000684CA02|nr:MinD/ParA family protein [Arthrobacter sp. 35W]
MTVEKKAPAAGDDGVELASENASAPDEPAEAPEAPATVVVEVETADDGAASDDGDPVVLPTLGANADPGSTGAIGAVAEVFSPAQPDEPVFASVPGWEPSGSSVPATTAMGGEAGAAAAAAVESEASARQAAADTAPAAATSDAGRSERRGQAEGPEPAAALTADRLLAKSALPPVGGWRLWLYTASFGTINLGDSDKVRIRRATEHSIAARLGERTRYVPVLSRKGGVGKTTVTTLLGMVLADLREDRVIAMDANPDRGTLSDRSPGRADFTARHLVKDRFSVGSFSQLSNYTARDGSRLDVLASDTDPAVAQAFDDSDYRAVTDILGRYYSIVLTDSGTGMVHSVMKGTLEKADTVVLVSGGSVDEARLASETLSWLEAHGRHDLVARAIVVINMAGGETQVDIDAIEEHFRSRVNHVLRIPYDKHLAEGSRIVLDQLRPATRLAAVELAALVVGELTAD